MRAWKTSFPPCSIHPLGSRSHCVFPIQDLPYRPHQGWKQDERESQGRIISVRITLGSNTKGWLVSEDSSTRPPAASLTGETDGPGAGACRTFRSARESFDNAFDHRLRLLDRTSLFTLCTGITGNRMKIFNPAIGHHCPSISPRWNGVRT